MTGLAGDGRVTTRFRVAREGQTVDGRVLTRQEIMDMAVTYNPATYGARINVEHIAGFSPEPPFNAYGDVMTVDYAIEDGMACLYNTISALPNLQALNKLGQKLYPSIEFIRDFTGSGRAYQVGLAMTDNPASLGTQAIKLTAGGQTLRTNPSTEIFIMTQGTQQQQAPAVMTQQTLLEKLTALVTGKTETPAATPPAQAPDQSPELLNATAAGLLKLADSIVALSGQLQEQNGRLQQLETQFSTNGQQQQTATPTVQTQTTQTPPAAGQPPAGQQAEPTQRDVLAAIHALTEKLATTPANATPPAATGGGPALPMF